MGKCCREVLRRSVVEKCCGDGEECCREVLENIVVEKCWRRVLAASDHRILSNLVTLGT